ncbi:MAG: autotransporter domain-containing protein [Elusimicrobia bacterium]|nr:autotransporter domain-containing protein [Elusimicrobiota bacterium]
MRTPIPMPSSRILKKGVAVASLCSLLVGQASAATYNITALGNGAGLGSGTLRQAVIESNAAGGTNTLAWGAGSGGVITLLSDLDPIIANTTLDASSANAAPTIAGAFNIPLVGATTFHNDGGAAQDWTISSIVSGSGSLAKTGSRVLVLQGVNTYTGGTTVNAGTLNVNADAAMGDSAGALSLNGGTLKTAAAITSARNILLDAGGGAIDAGVFHSTFTGMLYGAGALTITGVGAVTLSGVNYFTGGTTVNGSTLCVNGDSALSYGGGTLTLVGGTLQTDASVVSFRAVTLGAGGGTFNSAGSDSVFYGAVTGTTGLTKTGAGTLYLYGDNTYSGGTTITGGKLAIFADANLGNSAGGVTLNNGTLMTLLSMSSSRAMTLAGAGGTLEVAERTLTLNGIIGGAGALTKTGGGTLVLNAANTYTGGTNINAGVLELGIINALPLNRVVTVNSGGTLEMGGFTQGVSNFTNNGTLRLLLQPLVTNLAATGTADLAGGRLVVSLAPQVVTEGQTFKPITFAGGYAPGGTGLCATCVSGPAALSFAVTNNANDVTLTASLVRFNTLAGNDNQSAIGTSLESLRTSTAGDAATVIGEINTLDLPQLRAALDRIGPVSLASMAGVGLGASGVHSGALSQRMAVLAGSARGSGAVASVLPSPFPGTLVADAGAGDVEIHEPADEPRPDVSWGFFTTGIYRDGRLREANTPSGLQPGYAFNSAGFVAGADKVIRDGLAVGLAAGYLRGHSSIYSPGSGVVDSHSARFGGYATAFTDALHADFYLGGAMDLFSIKRDIAFGGLSRSATANPVGGEVNLDAGVGYDWKTTAWGTFSPFAGLGYDRMMIGSFTEDGAGALNLAVSRQTAESLRSRTGLKISDKFDAGSYTFTPYASAGWRHEFLKQSRVIEAQLAGSASPFSVKTGEYAKDGTIFGAGFTVDWGRSLAAKFDYSGDFRSHFMDNVFNLGVRLKF